MSCGTIKIFNDDTPSKIAGSKYPLLHVAEFSTNIQRFGDQIAALLLTRLKRCRLIETRPKVLSDTTTQDQSLSVNLLLSLPALDIFSNGITFRNVQFEIVGFSSVTVRITGETVINVVFDGVDGQRHEDTGVFPFTFFETVAGNFPANVTVKGKLWVNQIVVVNDIDPSTLNITGETIDLYFTDNIQILLP